MPQIILSPSRPLYSKSDRYLLAHDVSIATFSTRVCREHRHGYVVIIAMKGGWHIR